MLHPATYASLDQAVQLVSITVQELGQISSLVQDLDNRVADQYSLTDVQIDEVSRSREMLSAEAEVTSSFHSWSSCLQLRTKETFPLIRRDWLHSTRLGVYRRAVQLKAAFCSVSARKTAVASEIAADRRDHFCRKLRGLAAFGALHSRWKCFRKLTRYQS